MSASTPEHPSALVCSICLRRFESSTEYLRCDECEITIELTCADALLGSKKFPVDWRCPKCSLQADTSSICEACCYPGGFLLPLRSPNTSEQPKHWLHPFCGYFHDNFTKSKDQDFFLSESDKLKCKDKITQKRKEKQSKEIAKLCLYCQRECGHRKECTRCHEASIHAICAYKENKVQSINGGKSTMDILCPKCATKKELEEEKEKTRRKSARIHTKRVHAEEQRKEEHVDDKKHTKRQSILLLSDKIKCNYNPKAINILKGFITFLTQADQLRIFKKDYVTYPIELEPKDFKVTIEMIIRI